MNNNKESNASELFSRQERVDILKTVFQELHAMRRDDEALENKFTFGVCTILLLFTAYVLKEDFRFIGFDKFIAILIIIVMTTIAIWFLIRHSRRIRSDCHLIVRIEQCLGFYEEGYYISKEQVNKFGNKPFEECTVYPFRFLSWGSGDVFLSLTPHTIAVIFCGIVASIVVYIK